MIIKNFHESDDGEYVCIASNLAGESSIIAVIKKGNGNQTTDQQQQPTIELETKKFDSFKELHDYQLNRLTQQQQRFDCEKFEIDLIKNDQFRREKCKQFTLDERFNRLNRFADQYSSSEKEKGDSAPEIIEKPKDIVCKENDDLIFDIRVAGNPIPKIYWFKNGQPIKQMENKCQISYENNLVRLHLKNLLNEDAGSYTILAENKFGSATFSINLNVHYIIEDVQNVKSKPMSKTIDGSGTAISTQQQTTMTTISTQQQRSTTSRRRFVICVCK